MAIFTEMYIDLAVALPLLTQVCCNLCLLYFIKDCHLENHLTASSGVQGLNEIFVAIKNDGVAATKEKIHQWFSVLSTMPNQMVKVAKSFNLWHITIFSEVKYSRNDSLLRWYTAN